MMPPTKCVLVGADVRDRTVTVQLPEDVSPVGCTVGEEIYVCFTHDTRTNPAPPMEERRP